MKTRPKRACRHTYVGSTFDDAGNIVSRTCLRCREQMPLAPANDSPEAVVELRAAAIVAERVDADGRLDCMRPLGVGVFNSWCAATPGNSAMPETFGELAGWLARQIATHDDRPERGGE